MTLPTMNNYFFKIYIGPHPQDFLYIFTSDFNAAVDTMSHHTQ